jgi:hypothetical protein
MARQAPTRRIPPVLEDVVLDQALVDECLEIMATSEGQPLLDVRAWAKDKTELSPVIRQRPQLMIQYMRFYHVDQFRMTMIPTNIRRSMDNLLGLDVITPEYCENLIALLDEIKAAAQEKKAELES